MKKTIKELVFQIIPVMIGVYLGFVASNLSDKNQRKHQTEVLVENLLSEIETNERRLEALVDYHMLLRDSCSFYSNSKNDMIQMKFFKGTRISKLTNSAYDTGIKTGVINELKINDIQALNQLYQQFLI